MQNFEEKFDVKCIHCFYWIPNFTVVRGNIKHTKNNHLSFTGSRKQVSHGEEPFKTYLWEKGNTFDWKL